MTRVELEKISNIDVNSFIEKGMRVGISYISKKYAKVDDSKKKKSIIYWDMNNLYGFGMIQPMPVSDFTFTRFSWFRIYVQRKLIAWFYRAGCRLKQHLGIHFIFLFDSQELKRHANGKQLKLKLLIKQQLNY